MIVKTKDMDLIIKMKKILINNEERIPWIRKNEINIYKYFKEPTRSLHLVTFLKK